MTDLTLYTRRRCHFCDRMNAVVRDAAEAWTLTVEEVDVDADPALAERYGHDVPVLVADGREIARHRITADALQALLRSRRAGRQSG